MICVPSHCPLSTQSELYRIRDHNRIASHTKYLLTFCSAYTTPSQAVAGNALNVWILGSVAGNRNRPHIHLLPPISISKNKTSPAFGNAGPKNKGDKKSQGSEIASTKCRLLATHEDEATDGAPEVVRKPKDAEEPQLAADEHHTEHAEDAVRVGNGVHRDDEPLTFRLVLVREAQSRSDFRRAELP